MPVLGNERPSACRGAQPTTDGLGNFILENCAPSPTTPSLDEANGTTCQPRGTLRDHPVGSRYTPCPAWRDGLAPGAGLGSPPRPKMAPTTMRATAAARPTARP